MSDAQLRWHPGDDGRSVDEKIDSHSFHKNQFLGVVTDLS